LLVCPLVSVEFPSVSAASYRRSSGGRRRYARNVHADLESTEQVFADADNGGPSFSFLDAAGGCRITEGVDPLSIGKRVEGKAGRSWWTPTGWRRSRESIYNQPTVTVPMRRLACGRHPSALSDYEYGFHATAEWHGQYRSLARLEKTVSTGFRGLSSAACGVT